MLTLKHTTISCISIALSTLLIACGGSNGSSMPEETNSQPASFTPEVSSDTYSPQISAYANNQALVAWRQNDTQRLSLYASTLTNNQWGSTSIIDSNNTQDATLLRTAINSNGNAVAAWVQWDGNRYNVWANLYSHASGWGTAELIETNDNGNALNPAVAINASGHAIVIWSHTDPLLNIGRIMVKHYANASWTTAQEISSASAHATSPQIALNDDNFAIAVWTQLINGWVSVYSSHYANAWSTAEAIEDKNTNTSAVTLAMNNAGIAHAAWIQSDGTTNQAWSNRYTPTDSWSGNEIISNTEHAKKNPQVSISASGNALAIWQQIDKAASTTPANLRESLWSSHYASGGWTKATLVENNNSSSAYSPSLTFNTAGDAIAAWTQQATTNKDAKIWINHFSGTTNSWGNAEIICHENNRHASNPQLANNQSTLTLIAWEFTGDNVYACDDTASKHAGNALQRIHIDWLP